MKRWATIFSTIGAILLVLLAVPFSTNLETATNNTKSYLPLFAWIPLWVQAVVASRWVTALGVGVLAFTAGRWSVDVETNLFGKSSKAALGASILGNDMLDLASDLTSEFGTPVGIDARLRARIRLMRKRANELRVPFPEQQHAKEGFLAFREYLQEIGHYLQEGELTIARSKASVILNGVGQLVA